MIIIIKKWKEDDEYFEVQYDTETKKYYSCFRDVKRKNQSNKRRTWRRRTK